MESIFISNITINKVRHLQNIEIPLSKEKKKHLIITGKNGSGKTSLLDAIAELLDIKNIKVNDIMFKFTTNATEAEQDARILAYYKLLSQEKLDDDSHGNRMKMSPNYALGSYLPSNKGYNVYLDYIVSRDANVKLYCQTDADAMYQQLKEGKMIAAYYQANRAFEATDPNYVEKVELQPVYGVYEQPRKELLKYLLDLKMTEALALTRGKKEKADKIQLWFDSFQNLLKKILEDDSVQLVFDEDTFKFSITMNGREPFDFNTLSSGYAAIMDIVVDLMIRMEKKVDTVFDFAVPGIVLIDEIETHLHLELQKNIMELLTTLFPNIQFIVSTHSPFILNSIADVVIYDLEKDRLVKNGLTNIPYGGIVEGYFNADSMSFVLKEKYERYRALVCKKQLTDDDIEEIVELEMYLDEIPDYLALDITTEYQRLKLMLKSREDI